MCSCFRESVQIFGIGEWKGECILSCHIVLFVFFQSSLDFASHNLVLILTRGIPEVWEESVLGFKNKTSLLFTLHRMKQSLWFGSFVSLFLTKKIEQILLKNRAREPIADLYKHSQLRSISKLLVGSFFYSFLYAYICTYT